MKIEKIHLVAFSPTRTSWKVANAIAEGVGATSVQKTDLTYAGVDRLLIPADTLAVFAVPVYGGHVAPLALKRMEEVRSEAAPAVAVVVYGNRAYEQALVQLDAFVSERGFKVVAGATFVGEHSYSSERYPIATGRPDAADLEDAVLFGRKLRTKIEQAADSEHLYGVDVRRILRPKQSFWGMIRFLRKVMKWRKSGTPMPRTPQVDESRCTHCGKCVELCPNQAILKGDECNTITEQCIKCCACVKGCPKGARTFDSPFAPLLFDCFKRQKENRIIL